MARYKTLIEKGSLLPQSISMFFDYESIFSSVSARKPVYMNTVNVDGIAAKGSAAYSITCRIIGSFQGSMDILTENLSAWKKSKSRVLIISGTKGRGERLRESLSEKGIESVYMDSVTEPVLPDRPSSPAAPPRGFEYPTIGFVVVSDEEIFGRGREKHAKGRANTGTSYQPVHELRWEITWSTSSRIGQYIGLEKLTVEGIKGLPENQVQTAFLTFLPNSDGPYQKYIGTGGKQPKINTRGIGLAEDQGPGLRNR